MKGTNRYQYNTYFCFKSEQKSLRTECQKAAQLLGRYSCSMLHSNILSMSPYLLTSPLFFTFQVQAQIASYLTTSRTYGLGMPYLLCLSPLLLIFHMHSRMFSSTNYLIISSLKTFCASPLLIT